MELTKDGIEVKTFQKLVENLICDGNSCSGNRYTQEGEFTLNGKIVTVYCHWSHDGNFHIYTDHTISHCIGEIVKEGESFPYLDKDGNKILEDGWIEMYDWKISIKKYE